MKLSRNHHYVPQFYLKCWSEDGQSLVWGGGISKRNIFKAWPKRMHTKRIAASRNLNTYELYTEPGEPRFDMEMDYFQAHDGAAATVYRMLTDDRGPETLPVEDRQVWAQFIIGLLHRSPEALGALTDYIERVFPEARESLVRRISRHDPRSYDEVHDELNWLADLQSQFISYTRQSILVKQIEDPRHLDALCSMKWRVVQDTAGALPTSDRPVVLYGPVVAMALNPTSLLVMTPPTAQLKPREAEILLRTHLTSLVIVGSRSIVLPAPATSGQVEDITAALSLRARAGAL